MPRPCVICDSTEHTKFLCPKRPRPALKRSRMNKVGKQAKKWQSTRAEWLRDHPHRFFTCYLCGKIMSRDSFTLDHVQSRSRHPELRYIQDNLRPCCWSCNTLKGSRTVEEIMTDSKRAEAGRKGGLTITENTKNRGFGRPTLTLAERSELSRQAANKKWEQIRAQKEKLNNGHPE